MPQGLALPSVSEGPGSGWLPQAVFSFFLSFLLTPQDFSGGPVATSLCSQRRGPGAIPGQGTRPRVLQLRAGTAREKELMLCLQTPANRPRDHSPQLGGRDGQHR